MWDLELKKAEHWRIDAFGLWCWRRFLRVPWTARKSNQSILKEINPELEGLMLKLKLQFFGQLMGRTDSLEKTLLLGKIAGWRRGDIRGWDGWMASSTQWTWIWTSSGSWWRTGKPGMLQYMGSQRVGHDWVTGLNCLMRQLLEIDRLELVAQGTKLEGGNFQAHAPSSGEGQEAGDWINHQQVMFWGFLRLR